MKQESNCRVRERLDRHKNTARDSDRLIIGFRARFVFYPIDGYRLDLARGANADKLSACSNNEPFLNR